MYCRGSTVIFGVPPSRILYSSDCWMTTHRSKGSFQARYGDTCRSKPSMTLPIRPSNHSAESQEDTFRDWRAWDYMDYISPYWSCPSATAVGIARGRVILSLEGHTISPASSNSLEELRNQQVFDKTHGSPTSDSVNPALSESAGDI